MKFTNIHLPVALVLLLALEHHQLHHLLLGVHLLQDLLLQQHLQKVLWVHDEELLSDQTVPTCKFLTAPSMYDETFGSSGFTANSLRDSLHKHVSYL